MAAEKQVKTKSGHGGPRPNSGRKPGTKDRATPNQKQTLSEMAREFTDIALRALVEVATTGTSESARVSAAGMLLDRGYGKAIQAMSHENPDGSPMAWPALTVIGGQDG